MHELVGYPEHFYIVARFVPKNRETLRPGMEPYIGTDLELTWVGTSNDDEPFPRQHRWITTREFEDRINMDNEARGRWIPNEDLEDIRPLQQS